MSMFNKNYSIKKEVRPLSVSGTNDSPYMQEMLAKEESRSMKHQEEIYERQTGQRK